MYAETTRVPVGQTQSEIRKILSKYNATAFAFAENVEKAVIQFQMQGKNVKFNLPMPLRKDCKTQNVYDQKTRTRWRALLLCIKAKLESVESGITTLEQEFMAHIMLPNGQTMGEFGIPQINQAYKENQMPNLLGYGD